MKGMMVTLLVTIAVVAHADGGWMTCSNTGAQVWNPAPGDGESVAWSGHVKQGKADGPGTAVWSVNGVVTERVQGAWKDGQVDGYAVWIQEGGATYEGQWQASSRHGHGIYTWEDGRRFVGAYTDNVRGVGRMFGSDDKPLTMIATAAEREAMFAAQDAAIAARKAAAMAELKLTAVGVHPSDAAQPAKQAQPVKEEDPADK